MAATVTSAGGAAVTTFTGPGATWEQPTNWASNAIPDAQTQVYFSKTVSALFHDGAAAASLTTYAGLINADPHVGLSGLIPGSLVRATLNLTGDLNVGTGPVPTAGAPPLGQYQSTLDVTNARVQVGGDVHLGGTGPDVATDGALHLNNARLDVGGTMDVARGFVSLDAKSSIGGNVSLRSFGQLRVLGGTVDGNVSLLDAYLDAQTQSVTITGDLAIDNTSTPPPDVMNSGIWLWGDAAGKAGKVIVGGDLNLGGSYLMLGHNLSDPAWPVGKSFDLLDFDPARVHGTFDRVILPSLPGGQSWDTSQLYSTGVVSIVPEPAAMGLLCAAGMLAASRRRRVWGE